MNAAPTDTTTTTNKTRAHMKIAFQRNLNVNSLFSYLLLWDGKGSSGMSQSKILHNGAHPSFTSKKKSLSSGTTRWRYCLWVSCNSCRGISQSSPSKTTPMPYPELASSSHCIYRQLYFSMSNCFPNFEMLYLICMASIQGLSNLIVGIGQNKKLSQLMLFAPSSAYLQLRYHDSRSRTVQMTMDSGYICTSSPVNMIPGLSVTATKPWSRFWRVSLI